MWSYFDYQFKIDEEGIEHTLGASAPLPYNSKVSGNYNQELNGMIQNQRKFIFYVWQNKKSSQVLELK